jgi:hypothetical protein
MDIKRTRCAEVTLTDIAERVAATTVSAETQVPSRRPI